MSSSPYLVHSSTNNIIPFNDLSVFTIGRSAESNLDIAAIYISRKQCRMENLDNVGWVIFDESRFKTTKLNNEAIGCNYAMLKDGDRISFSPGSGPHEYIFHCNEDSICMKKRKREDEISTLDFLRGMATQATIVSPKKNQFEELEKLKRENLTLVLELKRSRDQLQENNLAVTVLETENRMLLTQVEKVETSNKQLQETVGTIKSTEQTEDSSSKLSALEEQMLELKMKVESMDQENSELKDTLVDAESEIENLLAERCCKIIKYGSKSTNFSSPDAMDTLTEVELSLMKEDLKELSKKNIDLSQTLETVTEAKAVFKDKASDIIDTELYCTICSDLIYQAITLQCKHTFCKHCIEEWKKKKRDCPVCRTKIKTQVSALIVDNIVDKIVELFGGEMKQRREELIKEREAAAKTCPPRQNKRKRNYIPPLDVPTPFEPVVIDDMVVLGNIAFEPIDMSIWNDLNMDGFNGIVDLTTNSPPPRQSGAGFRGFQQVGRRRRTARH